MLHFSSSESGSPTPVQIVTSAPHRLLFKRCIANGDDYLEEECFVPDNLLYQIVYCALCTSHSFHGNKQKALLSEQPMYIISNH